MTMTKLYATPEAWALFDPERERERRSDNYRTFDGPGIEIWATHDQIDEYESTVEKLEGDTLDDWTAERLGNWLRANYGLLDKSNATDKPSLRMAVLRLLQFGSDGGDTSWHSKDAQPLFYQLMVAADYVGKKAGGV